MDWGRWTAITQLTHHGMLFVPVGYTFGAGMFKMDTVRGGSPYGAGVYAGDGSREANETELALAEHQGKYMATIVKRLAQTWWHFIIFRNTLASLLVNLSAFVCYYWSCVLCTIRLGESYVGYTFYSHISTHSTLCSKLYMIRKYWNSDNLLDIVVL